MFRLSASNRGMALPLVLVVLVVLMVLSTAILSMSTTDTLISTNDSRMAQAYYYAHSGADAVGTYIVENPDHLSNNEMKELVNRLIDIGTSNPFTLSPSDTGNIVVNMSRSGDIISINSTATYEGSQKTVTLKLKENTTAGAPFDKAIYSYGPMNIIGQLVKGDIACLDSIELDYATIDGTIYIHPNAAPSVVKPIYERTLPPIEKLTEVFRYPEFPFPEFPDCPMLDEVSGTLNVCSNVQINDDRYYTNGIKVVGEGELDINRGNTDRRIRTRYLSVSGNSKVRDIRSGTGRLEIYVDDYLELSEDTTLTLNLGDGDIIIRAKKLLLPQGHIVVNHNGTGKLYIYVDDIFHIDGSSSINYASGSTEDELEQLSKRAFIYYAGTQDRNGNDIGSENSEKYLSLPNNVKIAATLHFKKANIHIANGTGIVGNIISGGKKIKIDGGTNTYASVIYAPNAQLDVGGGAKITGVIICNQMRMDGGAEIYYRLLTDEEMDYFKDVAGETVYTYYLWE